MSSVEVTPTPLPPVDNCIGTAVSFSLSGYTPVGPTVTSTPTQMPTPDIPSGGQVTFNMLEETFSCTSVKVLKLCSDNEVPRQPANLVAKTLVANALFNIDESVNKP